MKVAVIIPSFCVSREILGVVRSIPKVVDFIVVVDDCCPEGSGDVVRQNISDQRVRIVFNKVNQGVGGATVEGYRMAIEMGAEILVKVDGDGQMDPNLIPMFVDPIIKGQADYTKGNRFFNPEDIRLMPPIRVFGNAVLSFFSKFSTGYYHIFDPTNGYTAISAKMVRSININKVSKRYFFESDMLFRLSLVSASVIDIPMVAIYGEERSNLKIKAILFPFLKSHIRNFCKRVIYSYYIRDFSIASIELVLGLALLTFGVAFGLYQWIYHYQHGTVASSGTVMLSALPVILGVQLLIAFLNFDMRQLRR